MLKDNLMMLRSMLGYSQEQVAEKVGVSRQAYAKWESGATVPDIEKSARLAQLYGCSIDSLLGSACLDDSCQIPPAPKGKNIWGTVCLNDRGQIVIPKGARDKFDLVSGTRMVVLSDDEGIALLPAEQFESRMRRMMDLARTMSESD